MADAMNRIVRACTAQEQEDNEDYGLPVHAISPYDRYADVCAQFRDWAAACPSTKNYPVRRQENRFTVRWHAGFGDYSTFRGHVEKAGTIHLLPDANVVVVSGIAYDLLSNDGATTERYHAIPRGLPLAPRLDRLLADLILPLRN